MIKKNKIIFAVVHNYHVAKSGQQFKIQITTEKSLVKWASGLQSCVPLTVLRTAVEVNELCSLNSPYFESCIVKF